MTSRLTCWHPNWLADILNDWLISWMTDWYTEWLTDILVDWLTFWLNGWHSDWLTDILIDWLISWMTNLQIGPFHLVWKMEYSFFICQQTYLGLLFLVIGLTFYQCTYFSMVLFFIYFFFFLFLSRFQNQHKGHKWSVYSLYSYEDLIATLHLPRRHDGQFTSYY